MKTSYFFLLLLLCLNISCQKQEDFTAQTKPHDADGIIVPDNDPLSLLAKKRNATNKETLEADKQKMKALQLYKDINFGIPRSFSMKENTESYLASIKSYDALLPIIKQWRQNLSIENKELCKRWTTNTRTLVKELQKFIQWTKNQSIEYKKDHLNHYGRWTSSINLLHIQFEILITHPSFCILDENKSFIEQKLKEALFQHIANLSNFHLLIWGMPGLKEFNEIKDLLKAKNEAYEKENKYDFLKEAGVVLATLPAASWTLFRAAKLIRLYQLATRIHLQTKLAKRVFQFSKFTSMIAVEGFIYAGVALPISNKLKNDENEYKPEAQYGQFLDTQKVIEVLSQSDFNSPGLYLALLSPTFDLQIEQMKSFNQEYEESVFELLKRHAGNKEGMISQIEYAIDFYSQKIGAEKEL